MQDKSLIQKNGGWKHLPASARRFLVATCGGIPDRVPVAPDFSNSIPARRTGLPFWDVYFREKTPLWKAYLDTASHFGIDAWTASAMGAPVGLRNPLPAEVHDEFLPARDAMIRTTTVHTPDGDLVQREVCFRSDPPSPVEKFVKDLRRDLPRLRHLLAPPDTIDTRLMDQMRQECHSRGFAFGVSVGFPGFQQWMTHFEGGISPLCCLLQDDPARLDELHEWSYAHSVRTLELVLGCRPDYVLFGGSGTLTLASPALVRKFALPALRTMSRMAHDADVPVQLHSCGKSRRLVDLLVEETEVDLINPLEIPPMGDVDLREVKQARGHQISLMGNLHTTDVMLHGTPELVRSKAREALAAAAAGGGFILSTGDQCGRDTPDSNLFALVETAHDQTVAGPHAMEPLKPCAT